MWQNTNCSRLYHKDCSKSILHSPTVSWILITTEAIQSEYLLNVNNSQQKDTNLIQVHHYLICHWLLKLFLSYISDMWQLKLWNQSFHFHNEKLLDMIHYKKFDFTDFKKSPCSEKPFKKYCHESNTSSTNLPYQFINMDFYFTSKSVRGSTICTITRIYAGRSGVQILVREKELSFLENI